MENDGSKRVLIVDDTEEQRECLAEMVQAMGFTALTASDGFEGLERFRSGCDLLLLDVRMPGMDGYETAKRIKERENGTRTPVVMVTGCEWAKDRQRAEEAGVEEFLTKPVSLLELEECVKSALGPEKCHLGKDSGETARAPAPYNSRKVEAMTKELIQTRRRTYRAQRETIRRLAMAAEYRDEATGAHVRRIGHYCALMGKELELSPSEVEVLRCASQLHDVGKIGIPDNVLLKPDSLEEDEWKIMKEHVGIGVRILDGSSSKFLQRGKKIAETHHEKWDGSGYPAGLSGTDIPLSGRICAIADVFDALTSDRPYRGALSVEDAMEVMENKKGRHFDPELLDVFMDNFDEALQPDNASAQPPLYAH